MTEPPPPWIVFPALGPDDPATQGAEEAYLELEWVPFWSAAEPSAREDYLRRWDATPEWRRAIAERFDPDFDAEADARDSAAWAATRRPGS